MLKKSYQFRSKVWLYPGKAAWHFITLPTDVAADIDTHFSMFKRGWGSLPVTVSLSGSTWETSIFPDKKSNSYLLPLKAAVRTKAGVAAGDSAELKIELSE